VGLTAASAVLGGCSNSSSRTIPSSVGVGTGVTLTTGDGTTSVEQGHTLTVSAVVTNDTNGAGVTWTMTGAGSLSGATTSTVTYVAPASGVVGTTSAVISATANANSSTVASVAMTVRGTPIIQPLKLFPAIQSAAYSANIGVSGGESSFTWTLASGTLPDGITLASSSSAIDTISGTPTAAGTYSFTLQAVDSLSRTATVALTLLVNPPSACVLKGQYAFVYSGFTAGAAATHAGSLIITGGTVTGVRDYKDINGTTVNDPITGTCTTTTTNAGQLVLNGAKFTTTFNYAANNPDANNKINSGRLQLVSAGNDSGSGLLEAQDTTAFTASALAGDYAFGLLGVDSVTAHFGLAGRLTLDATGTISAGLTDSNDATRPLSASALTGSLGAPTVALGRGTANFAAGGQTYSLVYYIVSANRLFVVASDSATGAPALSGFMTRQTGTFDPTALTNPSILSLWGAEGTADPVTVLSLGRLSNSNTTAGTVDVALDTSSHTTATSSTAYSGSRYSVAASGRGTLNLSGTSTRQFAFYLDGPANGYIVESGSTAGSAGLLEAQSTVTLSNTICGVLVGGTQFPQARGPISLIPAMYLSDSALSSTYASGAFSIYTASGYGLGTFSQTSVGTTAASLYILQPDSACSGAKLRMLRFGTRAIDASLEWFNE